MDFQDAPTKPSSPKAERNPNNYNILKGGKVDPGSKLYQRSIAGREQLKDYLNRLWNDGVDEADVFMAGVKSLMNRGHGYVGAYLDSKNPGRTYTDNQAKAITDQVMTDEGIGEHPGARLTRPKVEDEEGNVDKEATKEARAKRKEANQGRGFGPKQAPGQKAMPVGQQRKRGKRTGSERVAEDDERRKGITDRTVYQQPVKTDTGDTELYDREQIKKALEDRMSGKATTEDVLAAYQSTYQKSLSDSPQADAERRRKRAESRDRFYTTGSGKKPEREKKPTGGGAQPPTGGAKPSSAQPPAGEAKPPAAPGQPPTGGAQTPAEETDTPGKPLADDVTVSNKFKELVEDNIKNNLPSTDKNALEGSIQEAIEILEDEYDVDPEVARAAIFRRFNNKLIGGRKVVFDPSSAPERPRKKESAPKTGQQEAAGPSPTPAAAAPQEQSSSPPEEAPAPAARQPLPEERLGKGRRSRGNKPSGFTLAVGKKAVDAIRQAANSGKTPQQVVEQYRQGTLFPGGLVTDTSATNPLEGGSTPIPTESPEEFAPSSALPGSSRPSESPGQKTFLSKQKGKKAQILPSLIQVPKPKEGVADAKAYTKQLSDAGIPSDKIEKAVKSAFPPNPKGRRSAGPVRTQRQAPERDTSTGGIGMKPPTSSVQESGTQQSPEQVARTTGQQGRSGLKKNPIMDPIVRGVSRAIKEGRERHNRSVGGKLFRASEQERGTQMSYEEFSQSVRSLLR